MMKRSCLEALGILIFAAAVAFGANVVRSDSLALIRENSAYRNDSATDGDRKAFLTIELFLESMKHPGIMILDARSKEDFDEAHIPGARSLPEDACAEQYTLVLQNHPFDQELVVYCSGSECESAEDVAIFLQAVGYTNTKVYSGGWEEWEELGSRWKRAI